MRAALIQMCSGDRPADNLQALVAGLEAAKAGGADLACSPEITNLVTANRAHQAAVLVAEDEDPVLAGARAAAARLGLWVALGSVALRTDEARFANRSFLISDRGAIVARYDKIHMFDVDLSAGESYRESAAFRPGARAVVADSPWGRIGLTICYDLRFPHLHRALAQAGAGIILQPAAFTQPTGAAHWEPLLRARAIETGAFVLAAAQTGTHPRTVEGAERRTHGHSLAVGPWGQVLADAGTAPGVTLVDLDLAEVASARARIPALTHDRAWDGPMDRP
jgi:deaminated glutathione amidase